MTPEEIDRSIEFLLQHEARSETRHEKLQEQMNTTQGKIRELRDVAKETTTQIATLSREMDVRDQRVSAKLEKVSAEIESLSVQIDGLKEISSDLLDHAHQSNVPTRLENPDR